MLKVLIVDDQPAVRRALEVLFELHDLPSVSAASAEEALRAVAAGQVGVVVQDMNFERGRTSGEEGIALFRRLRAADPELPVLLITAWTSLETAVELVKEGASDYLAKPWDDDKLVENVRRLLEARQAGRGGGAPAAAGGEREDVDLRGLIYASAAMERLVELALSVARASVPILITGPNGAGKEKVADLVHANSPRRGGPFLKLNVGALPEELIEAELFGAEAGAYTGLKGQRAGRFEAADGGTLFLDEIDSLSLQGQVKLLRVLESGELSRLGSHRTLATDVRVLSATNADLERAVAEGRFREDLYFRLNVVELAVPPLAARPEDVLPLAEHLLAQFAAETGEEIPVLGDAARRALLGHAWPGNVRELRNRLQRASLVAAGPAIEPADLGLAGGPVLEPGPRPEPGLPLDLDPRQLAERRSVERALLAAGGVVARAAEELGVSRQALYRKMSRLGVVLERRPRSG